jgi:hypothetical protein
MQAYTAKFIGFINERKRPENFPKSVYCIGTYSAQNNSHLAEMLNTEFSTIIANQGMMISTDPEQLIDLTNVVENMKTRVFIPIHMITHIKVEVKPMGPIPNFVDTGKKTEDGKPLMEFQTAEGEVIKPS